MKRVVSFNVDEDILRRLDALPGVNFGELYFLEVRVDIQLIDRHHGQERHGGLHALTELHLSARDDAIDGSADHRAT